MYVDRSFLIIDCVIAFAGLRLLEGTAEVAMAPHHRLGQYGSCHVAGRISQVGIVPSGPVAQGLADV